MTYDSALRQVGEFGRYQKRIYLLLCLPIATCGMQVMVTVFILGVPRHRSVSISAPPSIGGAINLCIWRGKRGLYFSCMNSSHFISDNVYLKINKPRFHAHPPLFEFSPSVYTIYVKKKMSLYVVHAFQL